MGWISNKVIKSDYDKYLPAFIKRLLRPSVNYGKFAKYPGLSSSNLLALLDFIIGLTSLSSESLSFCWWTLWVVITLNPWIIRQRQHSAWQTLRNIWDPIPWHNRSPHPSTRYGRPNQFCCLRWLSWCLRLLSHLTLWPTVSTSRKSLWKWRRTQHKRQ